MKDITAQSCADSFLLHWVARFGSPTIITTDRGAQFTSLLCANFWVRNYATQQLAIRLQTD